MELKLIASNVTEVEFGPYTVLFSYETPVAYHQWTELPPPGIGFFRTDKFHSVTTSRHINKWLEGAEAQKVSQKHIDALLP